MLVAIIETQKGTPEMGGNMYRILHATPDCSSWGVKVLNEAALVKEIIQGRHVLVNASIEDGVIRENAGSFSRLQEKNGISPHVILATGVTEAGRTLGYFLATKAGTVIRVKPEALYKACDNAKSSEVAFVQNGIYRTTDGRPQVASYPGKPFPSIKLAQSNRPKKAHTVVNVEQNRENIKKNRESKFTPEQLRELDFAKQNGVNPTIIANPKLSPEQMRQLWVAKRNKRCVEYFARPAYTPEQMLFLAERMVSKDDIVDFRVLLNPKLSVAQMTEVYLGIAEGLDVSEWAKPEVPVKQMQVKRALQSDSTYNRIDVSGKYASGSAEAAYRTKSFVERHRAFQNRH